ncbi:MAG: MarR family transcriptional regulator [Lachnospiraceae bacterium]|nr:MarR family transcriptional regulator [Lachnospiraceae bacterium]
MEIIHTLNMPTISEFANFIHISLPNATYRVNALVKKGYLRKIHSLNDKREIRLQLTERFYHDYNISCDYIQRVMSSMTNLLSEVERTQFVETMKSMLHIMDDCKKEVCDESANIG